MSSCVAELDGILHSMLELKPPGVSSAKIASITALCNANVQSETVLIQKVYTHFKKAPGNKKLGVLYVVDSVTRQWFEQARKAGQQIGPAAPDGTFAAGVNHVSELLPSLMTDIISVAPEDHKGKIKKLIDIWARGGTFRSELLQEFTEKLNASSSNVGQTTTPTGTPPKDSANTAAAPQPVQNTSSILANLSALANLAKTSSAAPTANPIQGSSSTVSYPQTTFPQGVPSVNPLASLQPAAQAVNSAPTPVNNGVYSYGGLQNYYPAAQAAPAQPAAPQPIIPQPNVGGGGQDQLQQQLQILQLLKAQGVPEEQWPALLTVLMASASGGAAPAANPAPQAQPQPAASGRDDASRDRNGYDQYVRSPNRYRQRSRSRSPGWDRRRDASPPRRRDSPVYGEYGNNRNGNGSRDDYSRRGGQNNGGARNNRGGQYRQRSPDRFRRSPSPRRGDHQIPEPGPKWVQYDPSIGQNMIKVYSRTLFVGGVTTTEADLRGIFVSFGRVQTCIVNADKRHAFVKMVSRDEAVRAKEGMEHYKSPEMQLRTRWGVGFGPRDCSDYQTGISIIPIDRLTDADRKWLLTAEFGGSGGKPIESGMCVEEPDIEIGAGVSSKAISRRMQTDKSGSQGPRSSREPGAGGHGGGGGGGGGGRYRQPDRREQERDNPNHVAVAPAVPGFGFQFPIMPNGVPMFPTGFVMPGQAPSQPPPPGAT